MTSSQLYWSPCVDHANLQLWASLSTWLLSNQRNCHLPTLCHSLIWYLFLPARFVNARTIVASRNSPESF